MSKAETTLEIELAWLHRYLPSDIKNGRAINIEQAYIDTNDPKIKDSRIRCKDGKYTHTIKTFALDTTETGYCKEETREISETEYEKHGIFIHRRTA